MEKDIKNISTSSPLGGVDPFFDDPQTRNRMSFDFVLWFYRILKYWYLFAISLIVCMGYAFIKNKTWTPVYQTRALMILENRGGLAMGQGAPLGNLVRNTVNQQMILQSHDMIVKTIERLPQMRVYYFRVGQFNTDNMYGKTPVIIEWQSIGQKSYQNIYTIEPIDANKCRIFYEARDDKPEFSIEASYGEFISLNDFYIKVTKTDRFRANFKPFNFKFLTVNDLVARYSNSIRSAIEQEGSSALSIYKTGTNPTEDKDFLTALIDEYQAHNLYLKNEATDRTIAFLERQKLMFQDSLIVSENAFKDFQDETGIYRIEDQDLRLKLDEVVAKKKEAKAAEITLLQITNIISLAIGNNTELDDITNTLGINNPSLDANVKAYNELLMSVQKMGSAHPQYQEQNKKLDNAKLKILNELKNSQTKLLAEQENLGKSEIQLDAQINTLPTQERAYARYEKNYKLNEQYSTYIDSRLREANLQKHSNIPDNYVLEAPRLVSGPINGGDIKQTYMLYFIIGLAIPLIFVICKEELFNFTIATKEECERISGFPVIGAVENVSKKFSKGRAIVKNFPKSSFAESFRNMRIRIEYMAQRESGIIVLVTSAEPADGKTFVAANIASIYQLTGKRVVLVDFDLRRPSVAKLLDVQNKKGVSNFLIGQVSLDEILITHPDFGFDIIPAGTLPPNPSELIKTKKTKDLIHYLHTKYDYVIVDCSPVGLVSDAYILAKLVDTTMFVVRRAKTNKSFFKSVITQIKNDGIYNVGLVFNDVKGREGYYGTSRYYGDKTYYLKRNSYYHDDYFDK
ncbi:exopolysaccharide transport family protein [Dysgonomonas sp. 520]|uniref:exopolysaccharide transport family protein n=1 Tax=Dysgonomonas sp. 520 TaxID=2302931 RepID=UPI0013D12778|nr:polysaccharide biosynthesis tyrosine autokinase [Dysgonomonas sp. 520]NDW08502.1 polysaccharide biosynthesis tyrosine autokinase [Dysgonomonas sp. 520]